MGVTGGVVRGTPCASSRGGGDHGVGARADRPSAPGQNAVPAARFPGPTHRRGAGTPTWAWRRLDLLPVWPVVPLTPGTWACRFPVSRWLRLTVPRSAGGSRESPAPWPGGLPPHGRLGPRGPWLGGTWHGDAPTRCPGPARPRFSGPWAAWSAGTVVQRHLARRRSDPLPWARSAPVLWPMGGLVRGDRGSAAPGTPTLRPVAPGPLGPSSLAHGRLGPPGPWLGGTWHADAATPFNPSSR